MAVEAPWGFWTLCHRLLLTGARHDCSWTVLPVVPAAMEVSTGLFHLPSPWLSPSLQPPSCSCPHVPVGQTEPVPRCGRARTLQAPARWWLLASSAVCGAGAQCAGRKAVTLPVSREGQPRAVASVSPGARGTRSTACLRRACAVCPAGTGRLVALASFGLSGAEAQSHVWVLA